jgi:hypothetical protein
MTSIENLASTILGTANGTEIEAPIDAVLHEMQDAIADFQDSYNNTMDAALRVGRAANRAKNLLPHGDYTPWLVANFGEDSARPMSVQWIRTCVRAADAMASIKGRDDEAEILASVTSVEGVAALLPRLERGEDPLAKPEPKPAATKAEKPAAQAKASAKETKAHESSMRKLEAFEAKLEALSAKLAERKAALDAREADLKEREKALAAGEKALEKAQAAAAKAASKKAKPAPEGADSLDAARATMAKAEAGRKARAEMTPQAKAEKAAKDKARRLAKRGNGIDQGVASDTSAQAPGEAV